MDIHLGYINGLLNQQEKILNDKATSSREKLNDIVTMLITDIKTKGSAAKIFFTEMKNLSEERIELIKSKRDQFRFNLEELLNQGVKNGEFRSDLKTAIVTFGILGVANWSYFWFNPAGNVSDREVAEIFVEMILQGIQTTLIVNK